MLTMLGITSAHAENGEEAIIAFQEHHFDLILMDLQMPILDGYSAASTISEIAQENDTEIPILAMSAAVLDSVQNKVKEAGMLDHISKPIDIEVLHNKLSTYLSRKENAQLSNQIDSVGQLQQQVSDAQQSIFKSELKHVDVGAALGRMAGNTVLFKQLLASFLHDHQQTMENMEKALQENDLVLVQSMAHTLKGAAGTIGASQIQAQALLIETAIDEEKAFELTILKREIDIVLDEIKIVLSKERKDKTASKKRQLLTEMPQHEKKRYIESLLNTLRSGEFLSELDLEAQFPYMHTCLHEEQLNDLQEYIRYLEYDKAIILLKAASEAC